MLDLGLVSDREVGEELAVRVPVTEGWPDSPLQEEGRTTEEGSYK